jgi:hypothetical protein
MCASESIFKALDLFMFIYSSFSFLIIISNQDKEKLLVEDPYSSLIKDKGMVDLGFIHAFVASLSVIIVSELGDKTFFIAAIMAMRHSRLTVFCGAIFALALMTVLSGSNYFIS